MVRVLIPTCLHDTHATAVGIALGMKGHDAILCHGADFPTRQRASISISEEAGLSWSISGPKLALHDTPFDVVWDRRPAPPLLPKDFHSGDRHIATRSCNAFVGGIRQIIAPDAFWVNPLGSGDRANSKPVQLVEAIRVGLKVPPTLCSNDPDEIRSFLRRYDGQVIYKTYRPAAWKTKAGVALTFTSVVTIDDLPDDDILRLSPGIFQKRIKKDYELRINYMGDFSIGVKIVSEGSSMAELDWRMAYDDLAIERAPVPPPGVDRACRRLMKRLGIVFGCFDMIVTPDKEYVFLEVNEMGQFLWIEEILPEIPLLDAFCGFLISKGRVGIDWEPAENAVRFSDIREETILQNEHDVHEHEQHIAVHLVDDYGRSPDGLVTDGKEDRNDI